MKRVDHFLGFGSEEKQLSTVSYHCVCERTQQQQQPACWPAAPAQTCCAHQRLQTAVAGGGLLCLTQTVQQCLHW